MGEKSAKKGKERNIGRYTALFVLSLLTVTFFSPLCVLAQNPANAGKLVQSNTQFAIDLYEQINTGKGNLFFSPYSISAVLALIYGGARGETAEQIADVMHLSLRDNELHAAFAEIQSALNEIQLKGKIELHTANSLWPQAKYPFLEEYLELAKKYYQTEITPVDYVTSKEEAEKKINLWVEGKTNNKIKDIIPSGLLDQATTLVLVNAIYFKGEWLSKFNKSDTSNMPFYSGKSVKNEVPMMHQKNRLDYGENEIVQVLEMPYAGDDLSMLIVLPVKNDGLQHLEDILTAERLKDWSDKLSKALVEVYFPRFTMTSELDLQDTLGAMGMKNAFVYGKANFSGMDGKPDYLYISFFLHKAFVNVNEEGTEAAAATAGCFPAGIEVPTDHGLRPIETVKAGTKVYAYDLAKGKWTLAKILKLQVVQYEGDMVTIQFDRDSIQATGNQAFYVLRGDRLASRPSPEDVSEKERIASEYGRWVEARDLQEGDVLRYKNGGGLVVTELSSVQEKAPVYFLEVERYHNSAVHRLGILAHNKEKSAPKFNVFRADHPFLFFIRDKAAGSVLFMGRVGNPKID